MSYEIQSLDTPIPSAQIQLPPPLPVKEFTGYDPNGHTTVTGTDRHENLKQPENSEGRIAQASPSPEESVTLSPKVSAIARREQAQRQREIALKQRESDLAEKLAKAERFDKLQAKIAAKDYSAAEELGVDYNEYTNHLVSKQAEKNPEAEKLSKLERELGEMRKTQEESTVREYQANQTLWKQEISRIVAASDEFSAIKELSAEDLVLQHINDSFEEDNVELTAEQAAKEIEDALVERAEKLASISKIKQKLAQAEPPAKRLGAPKTITQNMTVSSQKPVKKPFHLMSESEQIAEAFRRVQEAKNQR